MLVEQVLHAVHGETFVHDAGEQQIPTTSLRLVQSGFHHGACGSGKRCAAFLAPLADKRVREHRRRG